MKKSAGILLYRFSGEVPEVFLVHPGGPFWAKKDAGAWSVPKGEFGDDEQPLPAALREFEEETGMSLSGDFTALAPVKTKSSKIIYAWIQQRNLDASQVKSNDFDMEWPPGSGRVQSFPEIDKAAWFDLPTAGEKINVGQLPLLQELAERINAGRLPGEITR